MSDTAKLTEEIMAIVGELKPDADIPDTDPSSLNLIDNIGLDSLDLINLLFRIQEDYNVKVTSDDIGKKNLLIVANLVAFVAAES
jgi:acyl carrier protein